MKLLQCSICTKKRKVETHRRLTQYNNDEDNWIACCKECKAEDDAHWKEMWKDYYESQGFGGMY